MLKRAFKSFCLVYVVSPKGLLWAVEQSGEDNFEGLQALICSQCMEVQTGVMVAGRHGHLFCSLLQFKLLYELCVGKVEYFVKEEDVVEDEKGPNDITTFFETETKLFLQFRAPSVHHSDPHLQLLQHISFAKCGIHVLQKGTPAFEMLHRVYYMVVQDVASAHARLICRWLLVCQVVPLKKLFMGMT